MLFQTRSSSRLLGLKLILSGGEATVTWTPYKCTACVSRAGGVCLALDVMSTGTPARHAAVPRRRSVLPLINKRWARVLGGPSDAWDSVDFSVRAPDNQQPPDPTATFKWFLRRPGYGPAY